MAVFKRSVVIAGVSALAAALGTLGVLYRAGLLDNALPDRASMVHDIGGTVMPFALADSHTKCNDRRSWPGREG